MRDRWSVLRKWWQKLKISENNILLWANGAICVVIALGFLLISLWSYYSNRDLLRNDVEYISVIKAQALRRRVEDIFMKPVNIALTISNGQFFANFLPQEPRFNDPNTQFTRDMSHYLARYQHLYHFDHIAYASARTGLYYHPQSGIDRRLSPDNPKDKWFYSFVREPDKYTLSVEAGQSQGSEGDQMVFVHVKVIDDDGNLLGVLGVGTFLDHLETLFKDIDDDAMRVHIVNSFGTIQVSTDYHPDGDNLFGDAPYDLYRRPIMTNRDPAAMRWWYDYADTIIASEGASEDLCDRAAAITMRHLQSSTGLLVELYMPLLDWHLVARYDTSAVVAALNTRFNQVLAVIALVVALVMAGAWQIIKRYSAAMARITEERVARESFQAETEKLYYAIFEVDLTHDLLVNDVAKEYAYSMGISEYTPFSDVVAHIAASKVHPDYRDQYLRMMDPGNIISHFNAGMDSLTYEYLIDETGSDAAPGLGTFHWMRTLTRAFRWDTDGSVHALLYRQNIDAEKNRELVLREELQRDGLSKLYNKVATQSLIKQALEHAADDQRFAFFILDIDNFKTVNDTCGHAVGDAVIADFAAKVRAQFRSSDIIGRIGGDEFAMLIPAPSHQWVVDKVAQLSASLCYVFTDGEGHSATISASIGVAISPEAGSDFESLYRHADAALYVTKKGTKNGFTLWSAA